MTVSSAFAVVPLLAAQPVSDRAGDEIMRVAVANATER